MAGVAGCERACHCGATSHQTKLVALTGGPGAGKTAVLEIARKSFCEHIVILPEAASIVFGGGFWRRSSLPGIKAAQRAIFHIQREQERMVEEERAAAVALCDRGTLDGLAYWPESEEVLWREVGTSRRDELSRYAAVIHLRTPRLQEGYNKKTNPVRLESASEALKIDEKILRSWEGHPRRFVVESAQDFLEKASSVLKLVKDELPECCRSHPFTGMREGERS